MPSMRLSPSTCVVALGAVTLIAATVRADVQGTTQQLGALAGSQQLTPAISGSGVVWTNFDGTQADIYFQDVAGSGAPVNITNTPGDNEFLEDIDQGAVVFTHTGGPGNSPGDVFLYDTSSGTSATVAAATSTVHFQHPAISGNYVVFERITTQYDIDIYDRTIGGSPGPQVTNDAAMQAHPRVSSDVVVYEDYNANPSVPSVFGYHVSTSGPPFQIAAVGSLPDIDGNNVVYVGNDSAGSSQIYLYDLTSGITRPLTTVASAKSTPRISGSRVIWTDNRNGDDDVFLLDLSTNSESLLAGGAGSQTVGDVSGNRVVYASTDASGNSSVFLFTIAAPPPPDLPPGCDPAKTTLVDGPVTLTESTRRAAYGEHEFATQPGRTYYVCVDNGRADGSGKSSHVLVAVDDQTVLTPANFMPQSNPPAHVAAPLSFHHRDDGDDSGEHEWRAALFAQPGTTITVSIRVAK